MGYSPWGPKRVRQDLATKQQELTNADFIQIYQFFYERPFPVLGRHPGATLHSVTWLLPRLAADAFSVPPGFSPTGSLKSTSLVLCGPSLSLVLCDMFFHDWTGAVGSGKREVLFSSHRTRGPHH